MQRDSPDRVKSPNIQPEATEAQARADKHTRKGKEKEQEMKQKDAKDQGMLTLPIRQATQPGRLKHRNNKFGWHDCIRNSAGSANSSRQPGEHNGRVLVA